MEIIRIGILGFFALLFTVNTFVAYTSKDESERGAASFWTIVMILNFYLVYMAAQTSSII